MKILSELSLLAKDAADSGKLEVASIILTNLEDLSKSAGVEFPQHLRDIKQRVFKKLAYITLNTARIYARRGDAQRKMSYLLGAIRYAYNAGPDIEDIISKIENLEKHNPDYYG